MRKYRLVIEYNDEMGDYDDVAHFANDVTKTLEDDGSIYVKVINQEQINDG